jgi:hypothetical protein
MPSFKPKSSKNIKYNKKTSVTLDTKHKEYLNEFSKNENHIYDYKCEIYDLKQKLENKPNILTIEEKLEITDKILELKELIKEMKFKKKDYLLGNSKYIFEYFENKKNISSGIKSETITNKSKLVNNFFKIKEDISNNNDINNIISKQNNNIVLKYLSNVSDEFLDINNYIYQTDICKVCNKGELIPLEEDGILVCNICSRSIRYFIENEKPSYKEPPKEVCFYAYKRINHFKEILAQTQGKETTQIEDYVIESIKLQIKKERLDISEITNIKIKDILKKLGLNKYYEHIPFIKDKLGIKPPIMSPELEEKLCNLFIELQAPYSKYCPDNRVNFLNYYYTAYKLCELLGEKKYLEHFSMLKDPEKRVEQDIIWKKICEELDWEFIPTI